MISNVTALPMADSLALRERLSLSHSEPRTEEILDSASRPHDGRIQDVMKAMRAGASVEQLFETTKIDPWFLDQLALLMDVALEVKQADELTPELLRTAKLHGLADSQIAALRDLSTDVVRGVRWALGIRPVYKSVDTCAGEFAATTPYFYSTYDEESDRLTKNLHYKEDPDTSVLSYYTRYLFADPRYAPLGLRVIAEAQAAGAVLAAIGGSAAASEAYHAHRIGLGVPEGGRDFAFGDTFPHEALLDQLHGVSFTKGCFVGQEVVSRMQHRATVRKRVVAVNAGEPLPSGPLPVLAGDVEIGRLGSVAGARGLALIRLDRVADARRDGVPVTAGDVALSAEVPPFATFEIGAPHETA